MMNLKNTMHIKNMIRKNGLLSTTTIIILSVIVIVSYFELFQMITGISIALAQQTLPSSSSLSQQQQQNLAVQNQQSLPQNNQPTLTTIFKNAQNSVVQITSIVSNPNTNIIINDNPIQSQSERLGSGFVYDKQGHIITNSHVVEGVKTVDVTFVDGNTYTAKVVGLDRDNDIAVLQITDDFSQENIVPLSMGNSSNLQVGQQIIAIGNPYGLADTMTTGIISQTGRLLSDPNNQYSIPNTIQIDAPINPGNSGGPLMDMQGQVVGINTAIFSDSGAFSGIGFAIPSNTIVKEVPELIKTGTYKHPWLGIAGSSLTPQIDQAMSLSKNFKGVLVSTSISGGPADKAGLQGSSIQQDANGNQVLVGGNIITSIDGQPVKRMDDLISYIDGQKKVGDKVNLTVYRDGKIIDLTAILTKRPATATVTDNSQSNYPIIPQPQNPDNNNNNNDLFSNFPNLP
jgi:S1-C subfamily serine protease